MLKALKKSIYSPIRTRVKRTKELFYYRGFVVNKSHQHYQNFANKENGLNTPQKLLYVGSGMSALEYKQHDLSGLKILAVNNSIKAFERPIDFYLCSTDFPVANKPDKSRYSVLIDKIRYRYDVLSHALHWRLGFRPQIGKTIFLDGLYWAMASGFKEIYLLGFDHDYNKKRVEKWRGKYITDSSKLADMFNGQGEEPDAFYGQNTPDPLRHGADNLESMFRLAQQHAAIYGCRIFNLSSKRGGIEVFERRASLTHAGETQSVVQELALA